MKISDIEPLIEFHFYLHVPYIIKGSEYETCWSSIKKTCNHELRVGNYERDLDYDGCRRYCNEKSNCKYIVYSSSADASGKRSLCRGFSSCEKIVNTGINGTMYSRHHNCPGNT